MKTVENYGRLIEAAESAVGGADLAYFAFLHAQAARRETMEYGQIALKALGRAIANSSGEVQRQLRERQAEVSNVLAKL